MEEDKLVFDVNPVPKPRMTRSDRWKVRPATTRYWQFKDRINVLYGGKLPASFEVQFNVPMPKSWSNKKRLEFLDKPHQQKPDVDNYLKSFLDSLCEDDSYVYDVRAVKKWSYLGSIELTVKNEYNKEKDL